MSFCECSTEERKSKQECEKMMTEYLLCVCVCMWTIPAATMQKWMQWNNQPCLSNLLWVNELCLWKISGLYPCTCRVAHILQQCQIRPGLAFLALNQTHSFPHHSNDNLCPPAHQRSQWLSYEDALSHSHFSSHQTTCQNLSFPPF